MCSKLLFALTIFSVVCVVALSAGCTTTYEYVDTEELFSDYIGEWKYEDDDSIVFLRVDSNGMGYIEFANDSEVNTMFTRYYDGSGGVMVYVYKGIKTVDGLFEEYSIKEDLGRLWVVENGLSYTDNEGNQIVLEKQ